MKRQLSDTKLNKSTGRIKIAPKENPVKDETLDGSVFPIFFKLLDEQLHFINEVTAKTDQNTDFLKFQIYFFPNVRGFTYLNSTKYLKPVDMGSDNRIVSLPEIDSTTTTNFISGICDLSLIGTSPNRKPTSYFYSLSQALRVLDERRPSFILTEKKSGSAEHVFSLEIDRSETVKNQKTAKNITRVFLVMTYEGIVKYLTDCFSEHQRKNNPLELTKRLNFHEILEYDRKPYKLYVDLDIKPKSNMTLDESVTEFKTALNFCASKISTIITKLNEYWAHLCEQGNLTNVVSNQNEYIIFNSTKYPTFTSKDGTIICDWKVSFHIIWYPKGVRFSNRNSVFGFLVSALSYNATSFHYEDNFIDSMIKYRDEIIIDTGVYPGVAFRMPYNCKLGKTSTKDEYARFLLPVGINGTIEELLEMVSYTQNFSLDDFQETKLNKYQQIFFNEQLFKKGLIHFIDEKEPVNVIIHLDLSCVPKNCFITEQFPTIFKISNSVMDKNLLRLIDKAFLSTSSSLMSNNQRVRLLPSDIVEEGDSVANTNSDNIKRILTLFTKYFAEEVKNKCNVLYNSVPSNSLDNFDFTFQEPVWWRVEGNDLFIFHTSGNASTPCLANEVKGFVPHKHNNNYIILNIHTFRWYMGCHDAQCIRCFREILADNHPLKTLPTNVIPGSKQDKLKARSAIFSLVGEFEHPSAALFYGKQISNIMFKLQEKSESGKEEEGEENSTKKQQNSFETVLHNNPELNLELSSVDGILDNNDDDELNSAEILTKSIF